MKEIITKLADLSTYLDSNGHREESHETDQILSSLAESIEPETEITLED